jgi:hypothetical protein
MNQKGGRNPVGYWLSALAALLGMGLVTWSTTYGPGVGGDATIYLVSAQNLIKGIGLGLVDPDGVFRLLPYSAPLYPLLLSPFFAVGLDLTPVARWINILLFGIFIFLVGFASTNALKKTWTGVIPALIVAVSPVLLPVFSWAMAEPLTLVLGFGGLTWLILVTTQDLVDTKRLILVGILMGFAFAARYSAAAFLGTGVLFLLLWKGVPIKRRLRQAFILSVIGITPISLWMILQLSRTATVSSRTIITGHEIAARFVSFWPQLNNALLVWLVPDSFQESAPYPLLLNQIFPLVAIISLAVLSILFVHKRPGQMLSNLITGLWLFAGFYLLVILSAYLTTYPPITIDNRMLSPVHSAIVWIGGLLIAEIFISSPGKVLKYSMLIFMIGFFGWYGARTYRIARQNAAEGLGFNHYEWRGSELIARIKVIQSDEEIITNEPMAVLYLNGRTSWPVKEIYLNEPVKTFSRYGDGPTGIDRGEDLFRTGKGFLVIFNTFTGQLEPIYGDRAKERAESMFGNLDVIVTTDHGSIFLYPRVEVEPL